MVNFSVICCVQICLIVIFLLFSNAYAFDREVRSPKSLPLFLRPSIRIGRRSEVALDTDKRVVGKIMLAPRIGRSNLRNWLANDYDKNGENHLGSSGGMWFGPRLGRIQKRETDNNRLQYQWPQVFIEAREPKDYHRMLPHIRVGKNSDFALFPTTVFRMPDKYMERLIRDPEEVTDVDDNQEIAA